MILYFDNFLTNTTLGTHYYGLEKIRKSKTNYKNRSKKLICAYSLYSYSKFKFDFSLINLKTEKKSDFNFIKKLCLKNFKNKLKINNFRSDNLKTFNSSLKIIKKYMKNQWIFVMGNIDHPIIANNLDNLNQTIKFANKYKNESKYISIMVSHQVEYLNICNKNLVLPNLLNFPYKKIHECENFLVLKLNKNHKAHTPAIQIMNFKMLSDLIKATDFKKNIFRTDEMNNNKIKEHIMIVPKKIICDHYDGYSHVNIWGCHLPYKKYPPLFVPDKFFTKKFEIFYGFNKRLKNGVNINPLANNYSFENSILGTDLKIKLSDLPFFWKSRIKSIKINKNLDHKKIESVSKKNKQKNPYEEKNIIMIKCFLLYLYVLRKVKNFYHKNLKI
jgi:hypothetical protein